MKNKKLAAIHEAGHAFMLQYLGFGFLITLRIEEVEHWKGDTDSCEDRRGVLLKAVKSGYKLNESDIQYLEDNLTVLLAGIVAEEIYCEREPTNSKEMAEGQQGRTDEEDYKDIWTELLNRDQNDLQDDIETRKRRLQGLLTTHFDEVSSIANELFNNNFLKRAPTGLSS